MQNLDMCGFEIKRDQEIEKGRERDGLGFSQVKISRERGREER